MKPFELLRPTSLDEAVSALTVEPGRREARAGGIDLIDRLKEGTSSPTALVELRRVAGDDAHLLRVLGERELPGEKTPRAGFQIGALTTLADLAGSDLGHAGRALVDAAKQAATPSIRNVATVGGNLLQRPRCWYFRHRDLVCLKKGGAMCLAVMGDHRYHAILGAGPSWIVHPSSLGAPLMALDARALVRRLDGTVEDIGFEELFVLPEKDSSREHVLEPGEVLVGVWIPKAGKRHRSAYAAAREKQSHDWPLAEAAVALELDGAGRMTKVRVALGHVAPVPWNAPTAAAALEGQAPSDEVFLRAAEAALEKAEPLDGNAYKVPMVRGLLRQALHEATGLPLPE